jgi:hypothetical protein
MSVTADSDNNCATDSERLDYRAIWAAFSGERETDNGERIFEDIWLTIFHLE